MCLLTTLIYLRSTLKNLKYRYFFFFLSNGIYLRIIIVERESHFDENKIFKLFYSVTTIPVPDVSRATIEDESCSIGSAGSLVKRNQPSSAMSWDEFQNSDGKSSRF